MSKLILTMKCEEAKSHFNASSLMVYKFSSEHEQTQIVANLDNKYEVGDIAIIALEGSILKDGTTISRSVIRGVTSHGIALGKSNKPVGTDLTLEYCKKYKYNGDLIRWPKIGLLSDVNYKLKKNKRTKKVTYKSKVKLDGTNASIVLSNSDIIVQSRKRIITPDDDHCGFAGWVNDNRELFKNCRNSANNVIADELVIIYGEWAGHNIQRRNTAISKLGKKVFAIYAVQVGIVNAYYETDSKKILDIIGNDIINHDQIFVLPWENTIELDFSDPKALQVSSDILNDMVVDIEKSDPWVKDTFGIDGVGEGLVLYPILNGKTFINEPISIFI